jgi:hypothetical protein
VSRRLELVGGPFDGSSIAYRPTAFVFVFGRLDRPRGSAMPRPGRAVYRRAGDALVAAEDYVACGCGAIRDRDVACICGAQRLAESAMRC